MMLLQHWKQFEDEKGDETTRRQVNELMPKRVKKRRRMVTDDGVDAGWEEYYDYIFPDAAASRHTQSNIRLLELAKKWSKQKTGGKGSQKPGDEDEEENEDADSDLSYEDEDEESGAQSDSDDEANSPKKMRHSTDSDPAANIPTVPSSIGAALRKDEDESDSESVSSDSSDDDVS